MSPGKYGRILEGDETVVRQAYDAMSAQAVDRDLIDPAADRAPAMQCGVTGSASVTGPGTFFRRAQRTLTFKPAHEPGWWILRRDLPDSLPIRVGIGNVWNTGAVVSNIVLRSGSPHNYMRMVEHIIALKVGMGLDHALIEVDSGDPPLFDRGSLDVVETVESAGLAATETRAAYVTVKEPVTMAGGAGSFLTIHPAAPGDYRLTVDCAVDFPNAIGRQRIRFTVNRDLFREASVARTNTTLFKMLYCMTIGRVFADIRNLGYTTHNVTIAGPRRYVNAPRLLHAGKSLEAVWHRAMLDLLAAVALIPDARLAGHIVSYKAGHVLDCRLIIRLYQLRLLEAHE